MNKIIEIANRLTKIGTTVSQAKDTLTVDLLRQDFDSDDEYIKYLLIQINCAKKLLESLDI